MPEGNVLIAFSLTLFAGLATGIGSALAFFAKHTNTRFLAAALGFSAGVMIYVSLVEIFAEAQAMAAAAIGDARGYWLATAAFFGGILFVALIDKLVPSFENPHEPHGVEEIGESEEERQRKHLLRLGHFSALAVAIHNFPEGLITFTGALQNPALGLSLAIAIAIHNIPEGISVAVPIYHATGSRRRAFTVSFLSGLSEPVGALVGYLVLAWFFNDLVAGLLFGFVAGIMVYISLDELLPTAEKYGEHHVAIYGLVAGMAVMALSLLLFA